MKKEIDFPLHLNGVKEDKKPKKYNLSIAVILELNNDKNKTFERILNIQNQVLIGVNAQSLVGSGIYKYPRYTIHFTVITFDTLSLVQKTAEEFENKRTQIISQINKIFKSKKLKKAKVDFGYFYTKETESLAIQAFPNKKFCKFLKLMQKKLDKNPSLRPVKIKDNNTGRFAVNVVRFFKELSNDEYDSIAENVYKFNKKCQNKKNLTTMKIKRISLILSDNWLSNNDKNQIAEKGFINLS